MGSAVDFEQYGMYIVYKMYCGGKDMATTISTADARKNFADIVNNVVYGGEPVILTRRGREVAALVSMKELELLQLIEDHIDIEDARKALQDSGENIPAQEFWKQLGV